MSVVVVGGDFLGGIEKNLYSIGVKDLVHISGRKTLDRNKVNVPKGTTFILVLTDFVNHSTAKQAKLVAKAQSVPLVFAKRSWRSVEEKLKECKFIK